MIEELDRKHSKLIEKCERMRVARGYNDIKLYIKLWGNDGIKPIRKLCHSKQYDIECKHMNTCQVNQGIRIDKES